MRNLLALIGLAVVTVAGLGWYLGWYRLQTETTSPGHRQIKIDVNTDKIAADVHKGEKKLHDALESETAPSAAPVAPSGHPVQAQPTNNRGNSLQVNDDGSVTYKGTFKLPALPPVNPQPNP